MEAEREIKVIGEEADVSAVISDADIRKFNREGIAQFLESFGQEKLVKQFMAAEVNLRTVSQLTDEDLEILGVEDASVRTNMLDLFANEPNQIPGYDQLMEKINRGRYNEEIMRKMIEHLNTLKMSTEACSYRLYLENPVDIPLSDNSYASTFVIKALDQMTVAAEKLDAELIKLQEEFNKTNMPKKKSARHLRAFGGFLGIVLGGYFLYKLTTSKTNFIKLTEYLQPFLENQLIPGDLDI
ncbi:hypothetical protein DMENIID0001_031360 [Sergentomyia squamirostris]